MKPARAIYLPYEYPRAFIFLWNNANYLLLLIDSINQPPSCGWLKYTPMAAAYINKVSKT